MIKRLIETAFPLAEASAASLHEKNVRHGHISTLHLWPARRPLAASRAAIAAALLPDPGNEDERKQLVRKLGGIITKKTTKTKDGKEQTKLEGQGGILWWGQESGADLAWFRDRIRMENGGKAPRVLDPFAGGGAIPLEAMRLGCEVEARDISPVAWFVLKCTLDYPQRLGGELRPLPAFALRNRAFMEVFLKSQGFKGARLSSAVARAAGDIEAEPMLLDDPTRPWLRAGLGWHIRAWGQWVLNHSRQRLALRYPTYAEWTLPGRSGRIGARAPVLLKPDERGNVDANALNADLTPADLADPRKPRWMATTTVAYLWARTIRCKACRATIPLLKTRWLCRQDDKRVRLTIEPNELHDGVLFEVDSDVPVQGIGSAARRVADKALGGGTMSRAGVKCPCCPAQITMEEIRFEGKAKRLGAVMTAVVVNGPRGKEFRLPTQHEIHAADISPHDSDTVFGEIPFGRPDEPTPKGGGGAARAFSVAGYGLTRWSDLFTSRQLFSLATIVASIRAASMAQHDFAYSAEWREAIHALLACGLSRLLDFQNAGTQWKLDASAVNHSFVRFALPLTWDYAEADIIGDGAGSWWLCINRICTALDSLERWAIPPTSICIPASAMDISGQFDAIITDPPYYDAIPYSDLMDFFYVWLRRTLNGISDEIDQAFSQTLGPKWDTNAADGELIDDSSRFGGDREASKRNFEDGMSKVFKRCQMVLKPDGMMIVVFANKSPDAWETLVGAVIRAGFVVEGSLPIQTEQGSRMRAMKSAALSSSVWLVCRKRPTGAKPGYDRPVLAAMRANITAQMRRFWDAGIRGPDFLWAATGPGLEAYSQHPIVLREATETGAKEAMPVSEFLRHVRHLVVDFAVGRVLRGNESDSTGAGLDDVTTYYLLHRQSFGMADAPVGAAILYAMSCGLSDGDLTDRWEILARGKAQASASDVDDDPADVEDDEIDDSGSEESGGSGSTVRLRVWSARTRKALGVEGVGGKPVPLIDRLHRVMWLWKAGDVGKVDSYLAQSSISRDPLFAEVLQALIALAQNEGKADETALLEAISNHVQSRQGFSPARQAALI